MKATKELLILKHTQLTSHPKNMRRFYPADQVREMAASIEASNGVLQPLLITKVDGKWIVVDGNMRLAAARLLADRCPPLECKAVDQAKAEQMLSMVVANQVRYDVDPVSEGMHYKALRVEGLTLKEISKRTGVTPARIDHRIILADLDEPIQALIIEGKLTADARVARGLLALTPATRVKLAKRLADNPSIKISTALKACENLAAAGKPTKKLKRPAAELSGALGRDRGPVPGKELREAATRVCQACNQVEGSLAAGESPAWSMVVHAADKTCGTCELKDMQKICSSCPAVALLRKLVIQAEG